MDDLFAAIRRDTTKFNLGDEETWRELFEPFIPDPPTNTVTLLSNEQYGPAERNQLDVYVPVSKQSNKPVLLFVHGGGFFSGDKAWSKKYWGNIGYFFAQHGIVTVVATHRLVPHVQYPGGAEDVQLMREWIYNNIASERYGLGSVDKVILFGHSSGGAHIAMNLYAAGDSSRTLKNTVVPPVAGIMYFSVPFWYDNSRPIRAKILRNYYGSEAEDTWKASNHPSPFSSSPNALTTG
ncbi:type B carboxylesterase [Coleophoma crateriformis]|uniref:Type B carboxylesterase n=1 Tax=Coleophoma crateriformis TaxID=565419 RepID=A0A3D8R2J8_9HELO|nr:type B carboxylesterase [Coleophoma crateriformis]